MKVIDKSDDLTLGPTVRVSHNKVKVRKRQLHQDFQTWWYVVFKGRWFISISCYKGAAHHQYSTLSQNSIFNHDSWKVIPGKKSRSVTLWFIRELFARFINLTPKFIKRNRISWFCGYQTVDSHSASQTVQTWSRVGRSMSVKHQMCGKCCQIFHISIYDKETPSGNKRSELDKIHNWNWTGIKYYCLCNRQCSVYETLHQKRKSHHLVVKRSNKNHLMATRNSGPDSGLQNHLLGSWSSDFK